MSNQNYLEEIRHRTAYPIYRKTVMVLAIILKVIAVLTAISAVVAIFQEPVAVIPFGLYSALLWFVGIPIFREVSLMFVDFVDSTLQHNSRS